MNLFPAILFGVVALLGPAYAAQASSQSSESDLGTIHTDSVWDVLPAPSPSVSDRDRLKLAGEKLGDRRIVLAGVSVEGAMLIQIAQANRDQNLTVSVREALERPVDIPDLLAFLDDVLRTESTRPRGAIVFVPPGRARHHGVLIHPDDIYGSGPRRYGAHGSLPTDQPVPQRADLAPAADGDPPGPSWTMRYRNPATEEERLRALTIETGNSDFELRLRNLIHQLREQGAVVWVNSTVRRPERGYLMWGAYLLTKTDGQPAFEQALDRLRQANQDWNLNVDIDWDAAADWSETQAQARAMAETYAVVFATEQGARTSSHYGGGAVDLVAVNLPRRLELVAPDGARRTFDLTASDQSRDLSLTPSVVDWVEFHFGLSKLRFDYPHWNDSARSDARPPGQATVPPSTLPDG